MSGQDTRHTHPLPVIYTGVSHAAIVYVYPEEPGIVWRDHYPDIATAQRNLRHYAQPAQVIPLPPTCQHGAVQGACRVERSVLTLPRHWRDTSHYVADGVCIHHPRATA